MDVRGSVMSIEALMTAVDAAGYVMVAEDDLPDSFGTETLAQARAHSGTLTVWQPVLAAAAGKPTLGNQVSSAWSWVVGRFASGAPA